MLTKGDLSAQQGRFNKYCGEFNDIQSHEALEMEIPAQWLEVSPRPVHGKLLYMAHPDWFKARKVNSATESVKDPLGRSRY